MNLACPVLSRFRAPAMERTPGRSSLAGSRPAMPIADLLVVSLIFHFRMRIGFDGRRLSVRGVVEVMPGRDTSRTECYTTPC